MCKCKSYNSWSRSVTQRIKVMISAAPGLASSRDGFLLAAQESHLMLIVPAFLISRSPSGNEKRALITIPWTKRKAQIHISYL